MAEPTTALPRITIQFCTQCKWLLRAAYVRGCIQHSFHSLHYSIHSSPSLFPSPTAQHSIILQLPFSPST